MTPTVLWLFSDLLNSGIYGPSFALWGWFRIQIFWICPGCATRWRRPRFCCASPFSSWCWPGSPWLLSWVSNSSSEPKPVFISYCLLSRHHVSNNASILLWKPHSWNCLRLLLQRCLQLRWRLHRLPGRLYCASSYLSWVWGAPISFHIPTLILHRFLPAAECCTECWHQLWIPRPAWSWVSWYFEHRFICSFGLVCTCILHLCMGQALYHGMRADGRRFCLNIWINRITDFGSRLSWGRRTIWISCVPSCFQQWMSPWSISDVHHRLRPLFAGCWWKWFLGLFSGLFGDSMS